MDRLGPRTRGPSPNPNLESNPNVSIASTEPPFKNKVLLVPPVYATTLTSSQEPSLGVS